MPVRIRVDLALGPGQRAPQHSGHAVNAALLAAVRDASSPGLSQDLHSPSGYKPYTVTPLMDDSARPAAGACGPAWFGVSLLADELADPVLTALKTASDLRIGRSWYRSAKAAVVTAETYEELLASTATAAAWELTLLTPAGFATARGEGPRREIPWPDPARAFAGLARRWTHFAPRAPLPSEIYAVIAEHVEVADFDVRMASYVVKPGEPARHGAVGRVAYRIAAAKAVAPAVIEAMTALVRYAEYAGIGDRTAIGMGFVRRQQAEATRRPGHARSPHPRSRAELPPGPQPDFRARK